MGIFSRMLQGALGRGLGARSVASNLAKPKQGGLSIVPKRWSSDHHEKTMFITASRFQWHKTKDMFHLYVMVGAIPVAIVVFCANVFVGPAELTPIPEDYVPKHWEYHKHPISRFIARYIWNNPQQDYEKYMHYMYEEYEKAQIRRVEDKMKTLMSERYDYQAYYFSPMSAKYIRAYKKTADEIANRVGDFNED